MSASAMQGGHKTGMYCIKANVVPQCVIYACLISLACEALSQQPAVVWGFKNICS